MVGSAGRCNGVARQAVRMGFHDAGTWSRSTGKKGGADGSILLARECDERQENRGLLEICAQMRVWFDKYKEFGTSMADLIHGGHRQLPAWSPGPILCRAQGQQRAVAQGPLAEPVCQRRLAHFHV